MGNSSVSHWSSVYAHRASDSLSWYEAEPVVSMRLLTAYAPRKSAIIDIGAGASTLVDALIRDGWTDITLLDLTDEPFDEVRQRLGINAPGVSFLTADVTRRRPDRNYDVWHDRAVFHFLSTRTQRDAYLMAAATALRQGGVLILGTFAGDGPDSCSGLPTTRYEAAALARLFADAFTLEHAERAEHVTPSGAVQPFTWVVLRRTKSRPDVP